MTRDDSQPRPAGSPDSERLERLARLDDLFQQALDLPPSERPKFLDEACADDPEGRAQIERLLQLTTTQGGLLDDARNMPAQIVERWLDEEAKLSPGTSLGPYEVVEEIGRGGTGIVYLAHRADGLFERDVALKLLKRGLDTDDIVLRFAREREILAGLRHPEIATLLDAGSSDDGRPYLVMDHVDGVPVDRFCDENALGVAERLRLFVSIAETVAYAHRNLVVHRDIKPGNILVERDGTPKLLDFGIAKLIGPDAANAAATRTRERMLTPRYASPEQLAGGTVTTATDVYQLGLLLCELLCGALPEPNESRTAGVSMLALMAQNDADAAAATRGATAARLKRRLRGDLETIVAVATHPEPARRYGTAEALATDVRNHLDARPIAGRKDSIVYRLGKQIRRHPLGTAAAVLAVALSVVYATTVTVQARRLAVERDRVRAEAENVEQVKDALSDLLKSSSPNAPSKTESAADLLARGREQVASLGGQPAVQAELWTTLGEAHLNRGEFEQAQELLEQALEARERLLGPDAGPTLHTLNMLGAVHSSLHRPEAEAIFQRILDTRRRVDGPRAATLAQPLANLGNFYYTRHEYEKTLEYTNEGIAILAEHPEQGAFRTAEHYKLRSSALTRLGRYEEAEDDLRRAITIYNDTFDDDGAELGGLQHDLATLYHRQGRRTLARDNYVVALANKRSAFGPDHYRVAPTANNFGVLLLEVGDYDAAEENLRDALRLKRTQLGDRHPSVASTCVNLGVAATELDRLDEAEALLAEARSIREERFGAESVSLLSVDGAEAALARRRGRDADAERLIAAGLDRARTHGRESGGEAVELLVLQAEIALDRGEADVAETVLRDALARTLARVDAETIEAANVRLALGRALHRQQLVAEARAELAEAIAVLERQAPERGRAARESLIQDGIDIS